MPKKSKALRAPIGRRLVEPLPPPDKPLLEIAGRPVRAGDIFIGERSGYVKIVSVDQVKEREYPQAHKASDRGPIVTRVYVRYRKMESDDHYEIDPGQAAGARWAKRISAKQAREFAEHYGIRVDGDIAQAEAAAIALALDPDRLAPEPDEALDRRITTTGDKQHLETVRAMVAQRQNQIEYASRMLAAKAAALRSLMSDYESQMKMIARAIGVLETYLGVWQEIYIIRDGDPAPSDTPISLRQQILFMDEECGDPRRGAGGQEGIDWQSVDQFDEWMTAGRNFESVLPEPKGVVAIRPSRQERNYDDNPYINSEIKSRNSMAYLLIRNGERLYRIWLGDQLGGKLFPTADELARAQAAAEREKWGSAVERANNKKFAYMENMAMLQGLIDRTEILYPLPARINLSDPDTYQGLVNFIRDAEPALGAVGRMDWPEWQRSINAQIRRGSRVFLTGKTPGEWKHRHKRFLRFYTENSAPSGPPRGVYSVESVEEKRIWDKAPREQFYVLFMPPDDDQAGMRGWVYDPHPRQKRLGWRIYPQQDLFLLNYDLITWEDIDFYIRDRTQRKHFLGMMPILWDLRDEMQKEREWEAHFVRLAAQRSGQSESAVWAAVAWWKNKVIWKRPIRQDDAKALRMIERYLRNPETIERETGNE